jgi:hypothetical protein
MLYPLSYGGLIMDYLSSDKEQQQSVRGGAQRSPRRYSKYSASMLVKTNCPFGAS